MAGLSQEEMIALNPDLAKGVEVGMVLSSSISYSARTRN
jgi:hypothetical protein